MGKGKLVGMRIFVPHKPKRVNNHSCYSEVTKDDFIKFLSENTDLDEDIYMDVNGFYRNGVMVAKVERYDKDTFFIKTCTIKHRVGKPKPIDETKGEWKYIKIQTDSTLTIKEK